MSTKVFRADEKEVQREYDEYMRLLDARIQLRVQLVRMGYEPIPTIGKQPKITDWQLGEMTEPRIIQLSHEHLDHHNTGLRTGRTVGIDIDLLDDDHVVIVAQAVEARLG